MNWISVKDKLPVEYSGVNVYYTSKMVPGNSFVACGFLDHAAEWFVHGKTPGSFIITHWMPLPEPPNAH